MKVYQVTQNSPSGVKLTAEVIAPTADKAIEEFNNGRYRNDEVTPCKSTVEKLSVQQKKGV